MPTSHQLPRVDQGHRQLGPMALRTCPLASLLSQVRACLGPGGYCQRSGNGGPQTCLPAACGMAQPVPQYSPSSSTNTQDPCRADNAKPSQQRPRQAGSRGGREIKARGTSRGACDASHDDQGQTGARRALACAVSLFLLWCKGGKHRCGVPRHRAKVAISVQRDQDQEDYETEVTMEPKTASPPAPLTGEDHL